MRYTSETFGKDAGLKHEISITIPGTSNVREPLSCDQQAVFVDAARSLLAGLFGGATALSGLGAWVDATGALIGENVVVVSSYCTAPSADDLRKVADFARCLKSILRQECILVAIRPVVGVWFI